MVDLVLGPRQSPSRTVLLTTIEYCFFQVPGGTSLSCGRKHKIWHSYTLRERLIFSEAGSFVHSFIHVNFYFLLFYSLTSFFIIYFYLFIWEREGGREEERERKRGWALICGSTYVFTGWFLFVSWPGIEPSTLAHIDDAVISWATLPQY